MEHEIKQTGDDFLGRVYSSMMCKGEKPSDYEVYLPASLYWSLIEHCYRGRTPDIPDLETGRVKFMGFTVIDGGPDLQCPYVMKNRLGDSVE